MNGKAERPELSTGQDAEISSSMAKSASHPPSPERLTRKGVQSSFAREPEPARTLAQLLTTRFSCRAYRPNLVDQDTIYKLLELSQLSASWSNVQPWQVLITKGEATRRFSEALYQHAANHSADMDFDFDPPVGYDGVYDERRKECGIQLYTTLQIKRGDRAAGSLQMLENFRFFGSPHTAIITTHRKLGVYGAIDCGAYLGTFLLAAQSLGLSSTPQASLARYGGFVREYFNITPDRSILCGISFGYADENHPANGFRTTRAHLREVVEFVDA